MGKRTTWKIGDRTYKVYPAEKLMFKLSFFENNTSVPFRTDGEFDPEKMHRLFYNYMKDNTRTHDDPGDFADYALDNMVCVWKKEQKKELFKLMIADNYAHLKEVMDLSFEIKNRVLKHELGQIEYEEDPESTGSQYDLPTIFRILAYHGCVSSARMESHSRRLSHSSRHSTGSSRFAPGSPFRNTSSRARTLYAYVRSLSALNLRTCSVSVVSSRCFIASKSPP